MNTTIIQTQGVEATTALDETIKNAQLNWEPLADQVAGMDSGVVMPRKKLLYRSDTKEALGVVGSDYEPTNPRDFVNRQYALAESMGGKVVRVGFLSERSRAFAFVQVGDKIEIPRGKRKVGDPVQAYIYSTDGWDGGTPQRSRLYIERLKCANGMTSREIHANLWVSHVSCMEKRAEPRRNTFQGEVLKMTETIRKEFTKLAQTRMTVEQAKEFVEKLIPGEATMSVNRRNTVLSLFETGDGNEAATRWDAYNAVTQFITHHRTYRTTDATSIETNRFLGVLETDTLGRQALNLLLN
jgi:hypothetical protein